MSEGIYEVQALITYCMYKYLGDRLIVMFKLSRLM